MAVNATNGSGGTTAAQQAAANSYVAPNTKTDSAKTIAGNFDQFLLLLTTQLKNQNPLDPLDTNQFTQQLVQFASVEQQLKSNDTLTALLASTQAANASTATSYVGKTITAEGVATQLSGGKATWSLEAPRAAADATITIKNEMGSTVATKKTTLKQGLQDFAWDGTTATGTAAPDGNYTISITASDTTGAPMTVKSQVVGKVTGVDLTASPPVLLIGEIKVPLNSVKSLRQS